MNRLSRILAVSTATIALSYGAAMAQDADGAVGGVTGAVGGAVGGVTGAVDGAVGGVTGDVGGVDSAVEGATGAVDSTVGGVTGTVGDVTGGDATSTVEGITGTGDTNVDAVDDVDTAATGIGGSVGTFSDVLSLMNSGDISNTDFANVSQIQVVEIQDFADFDTDAFNQVLSENQADIAGIQDSINSNEAVANALSDANIDVSDIVAVDASDTGNVTIYTDRN